MPYYPVFIPLFFAISVWISIEKKWKALEYLAKPAFLLSLLAYIGLSVGFGGRMIWFTIGAFFCLAGDLLLLLWRERFIFGLLAFLVGHIFYVIGFNDLEPFLNLWGVFLIVILAAYVAWFDRQLVVSLQAKGKKSLLIAALLYSVVISLMVYSALMTWTRPGWPVIASLFVSLGALLFYACDSILAYDRFIAPISHGHLKYLVVYHLGQIGILFGAILHIIK